MNPVVSIIPVNIKANLKFQIPNSKFGFRISDFGFRISDFGFRISDFGFRIEPTIFASLKLPEEVY